MPACGLRAAASAMPWSSRDPLGGCPHLSEALSVDSQTVCPGCSARSRPGSSRGGRSGDLRQGSRGTGSGLHEGRGFRRSRRPARLPATGVVAPMREHVERPPLDNPVARTPRCDRTPGAGRAGGGDHPAKARGRGPNRALHPTAAPRPFEQDSSVPFWPRRVSANAFGCNVSSNGMVNGLLLRWYGRFDRSSSPRCWRRNVDLQSSRGE
jgi:hypothetical protein